MLEPHVGWPPLLLLLFQCTAEIEVILTNVMDRDRGVFTGAASSVFMKDIHQGP